MSEIVPRPFIDYYESIGKIPVKQDISNLRDFVNRRNYLYTTLGFPLPRLKNLDILEVGPGTGDNAVATSFYKPNSYTLMDGSKPSIDALNRKLKNNHFNSKNTFILHEDIYKSEISSLYDLVICEGAVPGQTDPDSFLNKLASRVNDGGGLIITTISAPSILSEVCRRVLRPFMGKDTSTFAEKIHIFVDYFRSHLASLRTSTRSPEEWVLDVIFQDFYTNNIFIDIIAVMEALPCEFTFYNSSPSFLIDDRWYKHVTPSSESTSDLARKQYPALNVALIDSRIAFTDVLKISDLTLFQEIDQICRLLYNLHLNILGLDSYYEADSFERILADLIKVLPDLFMPTKNALKEFLYAFSELRLSGKALNPREFQLFWGRGQQYVSFIRKSI